MSAKKRNDKARHSAQLCLFLDLFVFLHPARGSLIPSYFCMHRRQTIACIAARRTFRLPSLRSFCHMPAPLSVHALWAGGNVNGTVVVAEAVVADAVCADSNAADADAADADVAAAIAVDAAVAAVLSGAGPAIGVQAATVVTKCDNPFKNSAQTYRCGESLVERQRGNCARMQSKENKERCKLARRKQTRAATGHSVRSALRPADL
eukprot:6182489-Pleurochrysis_carterae.AAC.2